MQMTASAATRRCVARSASVSSSSSAPRRPTSAAAPPASSRRARSSLTVRAFGPGSEIQEGVEVGSRIKVTKPIKVSWEAKERKRRRQIRESDHNQANKTAIFFFFLDLFASHLSPL